MKTILQLFSSAMLSIIGFIFIFSYPCQADWKKIKISKGGEYNSIAIDSSGHPHISYLDNSNPADYVLKHAYFDGRKWKTETVDSGDVGWWSAIAIDSLGHIHISYHADKPSSSLKYAYFNGTVWNLTIVDSGGYSTALAVDSNNRPHITHITATNEVKYIRYDGVNWLTETIAEGALWFGSTSLALTSSDEAYISFSDSLLPRRLFVASNASGAWELQNLADGRSSSLALDSFGNPHIVYYCEDTQELKYSYYDGSDWKTYATSVLADSPHIALDAFNLPHISLGAYTGAECLIYAYFDGINLNAQTLDCSNAGFHTSIALDQLGLPHISYSLTDARGSNLLNYMYLPMPDLSGHWKLLAQSGRISKKGQQCTIKGTLTIQNTGNTDAKSAFVRFYLSDDPSYDEGDLLLKQVASGTIKANSSKNKQLSYTLPLNGTASQKYIIAVIDADNVITESNESNNSIVSGLVP
jgi:hypothetical protein